MMGFLQRYRISAGYSVLLHLGILSLFIFSFLDHSETLQPQSEPETVNATVLDESRIEKEVQKLRQIEENKHLKEQRRQADLENTRRKEVERLAQLKEQAREVEQEAAKKARQQALEEVAEAKRIASLRQQAEKEKQQLAQLEKNRQEAEKVRIEEQQRLKNLEKQRMAVEKKRMAEEKKLAEEEQQRLAEQKAVDEKKRTEATQQKKVAAEKAKLASLNKKAVASANAQIEAKLNRLWRRPMGAPAGLACVIHVKTVPGGEVVTARVIKSSGNPTFDRSAERAVLKASPLPVPSDPELYPTFRNFDFRFRPDS